MNEYETQNDYSLVIVSPSLRSSSVPASAIDICHPSRQQCHDPTLRVQWNLTRYTTQAIAVLEHFVRRAASKLQNFGRASGKSTHPYRHAASFSGKANDQLLEQRTWSPASLTARQDLLLVRCDSSLRLNARCG